MEGFQEIPLLAMYGIRAFIGGCHMRGVGSKFRAKAHAHAKEKIICFRSTKWIGCEYLLIHEIAHVLTGHGHTDKWRKEVLSLGGTLLEVPGILRSYEKKRCNVMDTNKGY